MLPSEEDLTGKLLLIQGADPGYDWIFSWNIAGFLTAYGGANSHMAIRAAEFGIPAVIGVGEKNFARYAAAKRLAESAAPLAITYYTGYWDLWSRRMEDPLSDLETFKLGPEGGLLEIGKKPRSREDIQGQFMGLLRFTPESWAWVEETIRQPMAKTVEKLDMTTLLQELVQRGRPVAALPTSDLWLECDSGRDIEVYERDFAAELS